MHADSLFEWDSGFFSHLELGFPLSARRKAPSQPSVPKLKVPQFFHLCPPDSPHSKWACLCPGVGNVGCKSLGARLLGPPLTAQGDALRDSKCGGRGRQTILCPTGTDPPCHRLPKGAPVLNPCPSLVLLLNSQAKRHLWHPSAPQLGPFGQALTALVPAQAAQ